MKKLKQFKILFRYLKEDKVLLMIYLVFSILRYFEPLLNAFIWANAFEALSKGNEKQFLLFLSCWSGVIILCWVVLSLPIDLIYNKLEKKFMTNVNKDLYAKVSNLPAVAYEEIGVGEFINRMYTDPDRVLELLQKLIKLTCRLVIAIIIVVISFTISISVGIELVILCIIMFILMLSCSISYAFLARNCSVISSILFSAIIRLSSDDFNSVIALSNSVS